ncbi:hypothetical protein CDAR_383041 [Caerostris darwini]|uniref:Uncharacterized protein n=1 Tax=Caerostris darwini TaxID=1538125 RepID=A0AAV4T0C1_9ARAC|nr:hypothetical protein CDAR_383041 [Caerostris darwini]
MIAFLLNLFTKIRPNQFGEFILTLANIEEGEMDLLGVNHGSESFTVGEKGGGYYGSRVIYETAIQEHRPRNGKTVRNRMRNGTFCRYGCSLP